MIQKKKVQTDREKLISGWEARIKHHQKQLAETRKCHKEIEQNIVKKIKLEEMQLKALKKN